MRSLAVIAGLIILSGITGYIGYSRGYDKAKATYGNDLTSTPPRIPAGVTFGKTPVEHHYEFQTRGASIFRFDAATGEACWMQLSQADSGTPLPYCQVPLE